MKLIVHRINETDQNVHIQRNEEMFRKLNVDVRDVYNRDLLRGDLTKADAICLNWFENIDGGSFYMPVLRYIRRIIQMRRIRKAGLKVIFCMHNKFPHSPRYPALSRDLYYRLAEMADVILTFAEETKDGLTELFPKRDYSGKIRVIRPLNYIGAYPPNAGSATYQAVKKFAGKMLIGFVGVISPYKNVELLFRAAKAMAGEDAAFLIYGKPVSPEYQTKMEQMAAGCENAICRFERIPDEEMAPILDVCDVMIMPYDTRSAANSGTGRLAFSYGRTVVSPDIPSMKALPEELLYLYHYETDGEHEAKMMEQLLRAYGDWRKDPEILREKGSSLKALMERDYSEAAVMRQYAEIFSRLDAGK
ncbi:MAG: glycosyltransferase family 4 protein [Clostridia bacterium]|nr:glycosyltransferase family 4 protein [Clostridia bacterium]